jgi:hypothetical protein
MPLKSGIRTMTAESIRIRKEKRATPVWLSAWRAG